MTKADGSLCIILPGHADEQVHARREWTGRTLHGSSVRRCSSSGGFTLVELLVTVMVFSVVVTGLCDVFIANQNAWNRQSSASDALIASDTATANLQSYISNAMDSRIYTRTTTADVLVVCLPADFAHGVYVPSREGIFGHTDTLEYQPGQSIVFYLSDSTGSYDHTGNILWAGSLPGWATPDATNVCPDESWSLHPGTSQGRCSPVTSLKFVAPPGQQYASIEATVTSSYNVAGKTVTLTRTRRICLRNQPY